MKLTDVTHSADFKSVLDTLSMGAMLGTAVEVLPHIAAVLTIVWMSIRIGETLYGWFKGKPTENKD